jgi:hypothetical protein
MGAGGGVVKIGDEYVGYGELSSQTDSSGAWVVYTLDKLKRGWLNSTARDHADGERVMPLPYLPVASLGGDLGPTDRSFSISRRLSGDPGKYREGYVLIDNEVLMFSWNGGNGMALTMPPRWDGLTGLFRGMFGTTPTNHLENSALVYGIPWRYWDTYKPLEFDSRMASYQWSTKMDLARWKTVKWTQEIFQVDPNIVVHCLARIDGKGEFYDAPGLTDTSLLLEFTQPQGANRVDRTGFLQDAGQLDLRFYVEYRQGSFDPTQPAAVASWKRTPRIKEIRVEYDRPTQVLYHEDR